MERRGRLEERRPARRAPRRRLRAWRTRQRHDRERHLLDGGVDAHLRTRAAHCPTGVRLPRLSLLVSTVAAVAAAAVAAAALAAAALAATVVTAAPFAAAALSADRRVRLSANRNEVQSKLHAESVCLRVRSLVRLAPWSWRAGMRYDGSTCFQVNGPITGQSPLDNW